MLLCLSGGGSALMPLPVAGVSLADKQAVTQALLACGADIREINTVRKHLSQLKGGRFAQAAQPAEVVALILSDVVGDPLDAIASGPSAPDRTTFGDALAVLSKYGIESPRAAERAGASARGRGRGEARDAEAGRPDLREGPQPGHREQRRLRRRVRPQGARARLSPAGALLHDRGRSARSGRACAWPSRAKR